MSLSPRRILAAALALVAIAAVSVAGVALYFRAHKQPAPWSNACVVAASGQEVRLDPAQMRNASIIVGVTARRGLPTRAAQIALATAWQESDLRNLDHGDRDSLGLFQQRPSQGWGSSDEVQDPYHATNAFLDAMVKIKGWQSADVGDIAQAVQRSGYPDAYDKHVANADLLAQGLMGDLPTALTCNVPAAGTPDPDGLAAFAAKTLPAQAAHTGTTLRFTAANPRAARTSAAILVANASKYGITKISTDRRSWSAGWPAGGWTDDAALDAGVVVVRLG